MQGIADHHGQPGQNKISRQALFLAILVWALFLRLVFIFQSLPTPIFNGLSLDSALYDRVALNILAGSTPDSAHVFANVFYAYFLAGIYFIFGSSHLAVVLIQALLDTLSCGLIFFITRRIWGQATGLIAAALYAFYGLAVFYTGILLPPVVTIFLALAAAASLAKGRAQDDTRFIFGSGILLGAAALARPHLTLIIALTILWFLVGWRKKAARFPGRKAAALFAAGVILVFGMMAGLNATRTGIFSPFAAQGGINFYIGNNPQARGYYRTPDEMAAYPVRLVESALKQAREISGRDLTPAQASAFWRNRALTFLKDRPGAATVLYMKKLALFWRAEEIPSSINFNLSKRFTPIFRLPLLGFGLIAPLALIGLFLAVRLNRPAEIPGIFAAGQMLAVILFFVNERYRLPAVPFLIMFAAGTLNESWQAFRRRDKKRLLGGIGIGFILLAVINMPVPFVQEAMTYNQSIHYFNLGVTYQKQGELEKAERAYRQTLNLYPAFPDVYNNLGLIHEQRGQLDQARAAYKKALALDPHFTQAHLNLNLINDL